MLLTLLSLAIIILTNSKGAPVYIPVALFVFTKKLREEVTQNEKSDNNTIG